MPDDQIKMDQLYSLAKDLFIKYQKVLTVFV